jgi:hypothetical protein
MTNACHKLYKISDQEHSNLLDEIKANDEYFNPIKKAFGDYTASSTDREILVLRTFNKDHENTKFPFDIQSFSKNAFWLPIHEKFPFTKKISNDICSKLNGIGIGKVMYAKLIPNGTVNWHTDSYPLYSGFARIHIPLLSEYKASSFYTECGDFIMEEKYVYALDTKPYHTIKNNSQEIRIHLIIDVMLDRSIYFDPVLFLLEKVENVSKSTLINCLNSSNFNETFKKLATLLFYFNIHDDNTAILLWNSYGSRMKFFEYCNIDFGENAESVFENIEWEKTYNFVTDDMLKPGYCHTIRKDYK